MNALIIHVKYFFLVFWMESIYEKMSSIDPRAGPWYISFSFFNAYLALSLLEYNENHFEIVSQTSALRPVWPIDA